MKTEIKDSTGATIKQFSIVGMTPTSSKGYYSSTYQGLVIEPESKQREDDHCVSVYFFREMTGSQFIRSTRSDIIPIDTWDIDYADQNRSGKGEFLLEDGLLRVCPRIVLFRPDELIVQTRWSIRTLSDRFFRDRYHSICGFGENFSDDPSQYRCFIHECPNPATETAVYNVWGSVCPLYVCDGCMKVVNGIMADDLPKTKKQLLTIDGKPVIAQA